MCNNKYTEEPLAYAELSAAIMEQAKHDWITGWKRIHKCLGDDYNEQSFKLDKRKLAKLQGTYTQIFQPVYSNYIKELEDIEKALFYFKTKEPDKVKRRNIITSLKADRRRISKLLTEYDRVLDDFEKVYSLLNYINRYMGFEKKYRLTIDSIINNKNFIKIKESFQEKIDNVRTEYALVVNDNVLHTMEQELNEYINTRIRISIYNENSTNIKIFFNSKMFDLICTAYNIDMDSVIEEFDKIKNINPDKTYRTRQLA